MPFPYGTTLAVAGLGQLYYARSRIDGMRRIMEYDPLSKPIMLWNARTGKLLRQIDTGRHVVSRLAYSPDGRTLATLNRENTITLWEIATGKERFSFPTSGGHTVLVFTPDCQSLLAAGDSSGIIHRYSVWKGKELSAFKGHAGPIAALAVGGNILVSASADTTALVWALAGSE